MENSKNDFIAAMDSSYDTDLVKNEKYLNDFNRSFDWNFEGSIFNDSTLFYVSSFNSYSDWSKKDSLELARIN